MLTEKALVKAVDDQYVWLEPRQTGYCGKCSMNKGCGHYLLANLKKNRNQPIKARLTPELQSLQILEGDLVTVALEESDMLKLSALFYGLPMLTLIIGALIAAMAGLNELMVLFTAVLSLVIGIGLSRRLVVVMEDRALFAVKAESAETPLPLRVLAT